MEYVKANKRRHYEDMSARIAALEAETNLLLDEITRGRDVASAIGSKCDRLEAENRRLRETLVEVATVFCVMDPERCELQADFGARIRAAMEGKP